uniref:Prefoldin subunit 4 n=1 Tax=Bicosoecida sp. CB-2014 TaxID=1486930 RepID=A0A7S1G3G5_9STRA|mmetsp:Transcript_13580/g.47338  ORF Transcript_13580/g.47338 Transcript_13580/m.47338 type:complete len:134 (+) Transcript_13580:225-626(+)
MMLSPAEEEVEVDVRLEDQTKICEFGVLNARVSELRDEIKAIKKTMETYEDAEAEVSLADDAGDGAPAFMLMLGESFVEVGEEEITERIEKLQEKGTAKIAELSEQIDVAEARMEALKKDLYGRFGKSINLEA